MVKRIKFTVLMAIMVIAGISVVSKAMGAKVAAGSAAKGAQIVQEKGCTACHTANGSTLVGPSYKGLYGKKEFVNIGGKEEKIVVDDKFIKNKILDPDDYNVKGFPAHVMPSFKGKLSPIEINDIIAYIKSLK